MLDNILIQFTVKFTGWQTCFSENSTRSQYSSTIYNIYVVFLPRNQVRGDRVPLAQILCVLYCSEVFVWIDLHFQLSIPKTGCCTQSWFITIETHHKTENSHHQRPIPYFTVIIFSMNNRYSNRYFDNDCPSVHVICRARGKHQIQSFGAISCWNSLTQTQKKKNTYINLYITKISAHDGERAKRNKNKQSIQCQWLDISRIIYGTYKGARKKNYSMYKIKE